MSLRHPTLEQQLVWRTLLLGFGGLVLFVVLAAALSTLAVGVVLGLG